MSKEGKGLAVRVCPGGGFVSKQWQRLQSRYDHIVIVVLSDPGLPARNAARRARVCKKVQLPSRGRLQRRR